MTSGSNSFGALLTSHRQAAGLTQEELSANSQLSVRAIGNIERGRTRAPQQRSAEALADSLELHGTARHEFLTAARQERHRRRTTSADRPEDQSLPHGALCALPRKGELIGRFEELRQLRDVARSMPSPALVLNGLPGVGKTSVAVAAANEMRARFPDGQFFLELRGTDSLPLRAEGALARLLRASNIPSEHIPATLDERASLWRSITTDRRILLVLDNAAGEAQVRPLIPAGANCMTLITSRRALAGLEATHRMNLDVLDHTDAVELLTMILGRVRATNEQTAVNELASACGQLPLALRIAGNRLASRPQWAIRSLVDQLVNYRRRLDLLSAGDLRIMPTLMSSYRQLSESSKLVFRRLGLVQEPSFTTPLASVVAGITLDAAEAALSELCDTSLVQPSDDEDHYRFHQLIHAFAIEMLSTVDSIAERRAAGERMTRWLLRRGTNPVRLLDRMGDTASAAESEDAVYGILRFTGYSARPASSRAVRADPC